MIQKKSIFGNKFQDILCCHSLKSSIITMYNANEADILFKRLDLELMENIDAQYFSETRDFR